MDIESIQNARMRAGHSTARGSLEAVPPPYTRSKDLGFVLVHLRNREVNTDTGRVFLGQLTAVLRVNYSCNDDAVSQGLALYARNASKISGCCYHHIRNFCPNYRIPLLPVTPAGGPFMFTWVGCLLLRTSSTFCEIDIDYESFQILHY